MSCTGFRMSLHPDAEYAALQVAERAVAEYKARLALIGAAAPPSSHGHLRKLERGGPSTDDALAQGAGR